MIQPIRVHGMLIYNLLKRQLICPEEEKDDEMWFGLGEKKARFGREEFCLCSGLNMGTLPEGFQEKEEVSEESILTRYFVDENPSIELLEATFNRLTEPSEGDDALKMGYLLMVSQFFGMDEARTAIPSWVLSLVEDIDAFESFPWGSYIFDVTLCCLKNAAEKHIEKLRGNGEKKEENEGPKNKKRKKKEEENKEEKKKKPKKKKKKTDNQQAELDNQQNNDDSKCFTFHVYGFLLAFQVWAVEQICRLEDWLPGFVVFPFGVVSSLRGAVCIPFVLLAIWLFITLLFVEQIALDVSRFEKWRQRTITMFYGLMMKMMMVMVDMV
ncbi:hypothetical protein LWI29_010001 [Acer saccharum]|uniref:DUF1985 domain-containing protein n=1 Tax=Acer saccharum TaxID=4024 RepID=A0AA39SBW3_ACESA|nr:hypothetical protein LWI29_010001 [Acer saccharum]